jgi:fimbrial chaperone protein
MITCLPAMARLAARAALAALLVLAGIAHAGSFGVSPLRIDLGKSAKSGLIEVSNDDDHKLTFQMRLFEWRQDADGRDEYTPSNDLIFFPQIFPVNPGEKRMIRVGIRDTASPAIGKSYRLYVEEIPDASAPSNGTAVKVVLRFGVPIFVAPAVAQSKFTLAAVDFAGDKVLLRVRNDGNVAAKFEMLRVEEEGKAIAEATGWYVLPQATRTLEIAVPSSACSAGTTLLAVARAEGVSLERSFVAPAGLCKRP